MNWSQLQTVIWLRWRLSRNQFSRGGALNAVVQVIGLVVGILVAVGAGVGGLLGGALGLAHASPMVVMVVWDAVACVFLFLWMVGVLTEIQRSESIDLARLLHLPVSLQGIFVMNYVASHVTPSIIVFLPGAAGLCLGLIWSRGFSMALLFPLVVSFVFMVTAWTYCLRGWLVTLMVNPRKRRNVVVGLTLIMVLMGQAPNLYINVYLRHFQKRINPVVISGTNGMNQANQADAGAAQNATRGQNPQPALNGMPPGWLLAHNYVPVLWLPKGAMGLAEGNVWPALLGTLGGLLLGAAGLARAYRSTMRFYLGRDKTGAVAPPVTVPAAGQVPSVARKNFMEKQVPWVSEDVAALSLAFLRSMMRAPEVKMMLFTNMIVLVALVPIIFLNKFSGVSEAARLFFGTGAVVFTFFGMITQMTNLFGFDRDGFRALVLSPARRRDVLLAKNLALLPLALGLGLALLGALTVVAHLPLLQLAAGICKLLAVFMLLSVVGNFVSVWAPYRVTAGSLKPTKPPAKTVLLILLTQFLFPVAMIPIFIPPLLGLASEKLGGWPAPLVDSLGSLGLVGLAAILYWLSLDGLGDMMERREQKILLAVSREVE